jgi:Lhr-like helicase
LVLDELHTYRGRQGADVALLVRRVRERLSPEHLQCIGTSATMASEGSLADKSGWSSRCRIQAVCHQIDPSNVIVETLERVTDPTSHARVGAPPSLGAGHRRRASRQESRTKS